MRKFFGQIEYVICNPFVLLGVGSLLSAHLFLSIYRTGYRQVVVEPSATPLATSSKQRVGVPKKPVTEEPADMNVGGLRCIHTTSGFTYLIGEVSGVRTKKVRVIAYHNFEVPAQSDLTLAPSGVILTVLDGRQGNPNAIDVWGKIINCKTGTPDEQRILSDALISYRGSGRKEVHHV